jgi:hypothetical protein
VRIGWSVTTVHVRRSTSASLAGERTEPTAVKTSEPSVSSVVHWIDTASLGTSSRASAVPRPGITLSSASVKASTVTPDTGAVPHEVAPATAGGVATQRHPGVHSPCSTQGLRQRPSWQ